MDTVDVCESFVSIQGESSFAGSVCFFIRLSGCNLRCRFCDTAYAYEPGRKVPVDELVAEWQDSGAAIAEVTGGEPLLQPGFRALAEGFVLVGKPVLVETNGSLDISVIPRGAVTIMDVKCPGSGENGSFDPHNIGRLRREDEVKFVIGDEADYRWARDFVIRNRLERLCNAVFFSPVHGVMDGRKLGEWIVRDGLGVRLQVQLHKVLGMK